MLSYRIETALQGDWNWVTIFYSHYRSIVNHCDIIGLKIYWIRWKKRKNAAVWRSFKVIEVSTNRKPVCNFQSLPYRFGVIAAYCSNFGQFAFLSPPLGGLGTTYDVHLGLIGKYIVDFLLVLIELFLLGVTAELLRAKRDRKSVILLQCGQFDPKLQVQGVAPHQLFLHR